jgi:hypothetical protein
MPPMCATPMDIRSRSSIRASVKAVIGHVTAGLSDAMRLTVLNEGQLLAKRFL